MTSFRLRRTVRPLLVPLLAALFLATVAPLSAPNSASAVDGEILKRGTNVCTNVTKF